MGLTNEKAIKILETDDVPCVDCLPVFHTCDECDYTLAIHKAVEALKAQADVDYTSLIEAQLVTDKRTEHILCKDMKAIIDVIRDVLSSVVISNDVEIER